jgi:hypothetical protein
MNRRTPLRPLAWFGIFFLVLLLASDAMARGRGGGGGGMSRGGGGFSRGGGGSYGAGRARPNIDRSGPSRSGTFGREGTTRPSTGDFERPKTRDRSRVENRQDRNADRPDHRSGDRPSDRGNLSNEQKEKVDDRRNDRRERVDDRFYTNDEYYEDRYDYAVGVALSSSRFHSQTCTVTTVSVEGTTYYQCSSTWYNRTYSGGSVTYTVVNAPAGH